MLIVLDEGLALAIPYTPNIRMYMYVYTVHLHVCHSEWRMATQLIIVCVYTMYVLKTQYGLVSQRCPEKKTVSFILTNFLSGCPLSNTKSTTHTHKYCSSYTVL